MEFFHNLVIREMKEETGSTILHPKLCGIKQFQTNQLERYIVLFYKMNEFRGELKSSREGEVFWIKREELANYHLAEDFDEMIIVFEDEELSECLYDENGTIIILRIVFF